MKYKTSEMKYLVSCITLNLLFLANIVSSADVQYDVQPLYDVPKVKFFDFKGVLELSCNVSATAVSEYQLKWYKDLEDVTTIEKLKSRMSEKVISGVHTLRIEKPIEDDAGNYTCIVLNTDKQAVASGSITAAGKAHVKLPSNVNVVEAEKLRIHCQVLGKPTPRIIWEVLNTTYEESEGRVQLLEDTDKNVPNAILLIENIEMSDRGVYKCIAKNSFTNKTEDQTETFVRIKDKLAALWPFLGICAEVFILCAIILIYEKKRNKQELEESDTDQSPDQKNTPDHGKDSDVRHRK